MAEDNAKIIGKIIGSRDLNKKEPQEVPFSIAYWNTRCLGYDWKRETTLETINFTLTHKPTAILLTEIKCKTNFELNKMAF